MTGLVNPYLPQVPNPMMGVAPNALSPMPDWYAPVTAATAVQPTVPVQASPLPFDFNQSIGVAPDSMAKWGSSLSNNQIADQFNFGNTPTPGGSGGGWNWFDTRDQKGMLGTAIGGAQALGNLYMGMQQYNLAKETLAANKEQFAKNYEAQKTTTNTALEDRQRARVASNAGAYQSVSDYMNKNRVV